MTPLYISFCTQGTPYEAEAEELAKTLVQHNLPFDIQSVPARGSWERNCGIKPTFIRDMMLKHDGRPLVWVDADARIVRPPTLLSDLTCDMAFHRMHGFELLSGTVYVAPTRAAWETVRLWEAECKAHPDEWDQRMLDAVVKVNPAKAVFGSLPQAYCQIFDAKRKDDPVILRTQASRRLKGLVGA